MEHRARHDKRFIIDFILLEHFRQIYSFEFEYINLPYIIEKKYVEITLPANCSHLYHNENEVYVGSAEQSFIKYMSEGNLPKDNYQSITICNRDEKLLNDFSLLNFIKLELFSKTYTSYELANFVLEIYKKYDNREYSLVNIENDLYDINCNGIEVASFGPRYNPYTNSFFTFGTGLALPRFTAT